MTRRSFVSALLNLPFVTLVGRMEDIDVLGCKIKTDRFYRVDEDRFLFQWVKKEHKNIFSVGFMQVLSSMLYPIYSVKIKPVGTLVEFDSNLAVIETGKKISTFPSPIGGKVVDVNKEVERTPDIIISSPYSAWIVKIESNDKESLKKLKNPQDIVETVRRFIIKEKVECLPKT